MPLTLSSRAWLKKISRISIGTVRTVVSVAVFLMRRDASLFAAGLAFFAMISLAPFVVLAVAIGGLVFGAETARDELYVRVADELGPRVAEFITSLANDAGDKTSLSVATLVGSLLLLWSSTRLFMEVRRALHAMWQIPPPLENGFRGAVASYLKGRLFAAIGTLIFGSLFIALLGSRIALKVVTDLLADGEQLDLPLGIWSVIEPLVSLTLITSLIVIVFKLLPDRGPRGLPLWAGALATAATLMLGQQLVMLYVSAGAIDTAYGAAGSAVVFLVWAYWSSLGFLFGARLAWALEELWTRHRDAGSIAADHRIGAMPGAPEPPQT